MTITNILLAGILVALCVIAYGFRALIKRVDSLAVGARFEGDKNSTPLFAPRETTAAGQTINVNLSPLQASVPGMQSLVVPLAGGAGTAGAQAGAGAGAQAAAGTQGAAGIQGTTQGNAQNAAVAAEDDEPAEAKRAREKERALAAERERAANAHGKNASLASATQSGLIAVKCPACGAENSAYRNVCFNCGKSL